MSDGNTADLRSVEQGTVAAGFAGDAEREAGESEAIVVLGREPIEPAVMSAPSSAFALPN